MMVKKEVMNRAREIVASNVLLEFAPQTRVQLMRVIVYTGPYEEIKRQLEKSLELGPHDFGGGVSLFVYKDNYEAVDDTK